ncbi:MAG TPA: VOC family protein [Stellaceae bacterium]|nr:VOC family protein [Stellaceae bacterium]
MARPQLRHLGIHVRDLAAMTAFYTKVLDLVVTDEGAGKTFKNDFVFLTGAPDQHHQLVLVSGRGADAPSTVNQISFKVGALDELKAMFRRVTGWGVAPVRPVDHGNAWSIYFPDPEGNFVEVYMDTPWHVPQPHADPLDLTQSDAEILAATERRVHADPGFLPRTEREVELARRLARGT